MLKYGSSNYNFIPIRPTSDIGFRNFNSNVTFDNITIPAGKFPDFSQSYFAITLHVSGGTDADPTVEVLISDEFYNTADNITNTVSLASDPCACLFTKMSNYIGDKYTSSIENVGQCDQLKNMVFESNQTINTTLSTNNIYWNKSQNTYSTTFSGFSDSILVRSNAQEQRIQAEKSPFWKSKVNKLIWKPILPIFNISDPLPSGTKIKFIFNIDPNWRRRIIYGQRGNATLEVSGDLEKAKMRVNVAEMVFYLCLYDSDVKLPKQLSYKFYEVYSTIKTLQDAVTDKFSIAIPRGTYKIIASFFDARVGTSTLYSATSFNVPDTKIIQELTMSYSGQFFPVEPYNFQASFDSSTWTVASITNDIFRAYQDYLINTESFEDNSGASLSLAEWCAQPIFVHQIVRMPGDLSSNLDINIKTNGTRLGANSSILVMCLYTNEVTLELDNNSFINNVETEQLI